MDVGSLLIHGSARQTTANGIQVGSGTTAQRPANGAGLIRFNSDLTRLETNNGSTWANVGFGDGSVSNVGITSSSSGLSVSGNVTTTGNLTVNLAGELSALNALSSTGLVARTGAATYTPRSIAASSVAGAQGISISNGDGVAGNPTVGLSITGLAVANTIAAGHTFVVNDGTNNTKASFTQLGTYFSTLYVDLAGDTMTGPLVLSANPSTTFQAANKGYVDNTVANAAYFAAGGVSLNTTTRTFTANTTGVSTGLVANNIAVRSTATAGQVLRSTGSAGVEATWGALDLTTTNAVSGNLPLTNGGTGANTAAGARTALVVPSIYRLSFTNANLVANALTVTHSLGQQFVQVSITDNTNSVIQPDNIAMTSTTVSTVDFTSYGALTGTWTVVVIG